MVITDQFVELRDVFSGRQPTPAASFSFTSSDTVQFRLRLTLGAAPYGLVGDVRLVIYDEDYQVLAEFPFVAGDSSWPDENVGLGWLGFDVQGDHSGFAALATAKDHFFYWRLLGKFGGDIELVAARGVALYTKLIESATIPTQPDVPPIVRDYDNLTQAATQAALSAFRVGDYVMIRGVPSTYAAQYGIWKVVRGTGTDPGLDYIIAINFADGGPTSVTAADISYTNPTYPSLDTVQEALDQALAGTATFQNAAPTTVTVGGISSGTAFPAPQTVQQMFDKLLYPYQNPAFSSLAITGQTGPFEVGYSIPAAVTFTWGTTNSGNVATNSVEISDSTQSILLAAAQPNDFTQLVTMPAPVQRTTAGVNSFQILGQNTQAGFFTRTLTLEWRWRLFYGVSAIAALTEAQIEALAGSQLATGLAGTYACAAGGYKYICSAHAMGSQLNTVKDALTGFNVPMATSAPYTNTDGGGANYALVSGTNAYGVPVQYRVYRTANSLGGAVTLVVT